jgi:hemerythrin-like metal-binding protein
MRHFEWDPSLKTGCEEVDEQHQSLFALANALERAIDAHEDDSGAVSDAVYGLVGYVVEHFADEERLMMECGYPGVGPHRALHEQLNAQTLEVLARYTNGETDHPDELAPLVCDWLTNHIDGHDKSFVEFKHRQDAAKDRAAHVEI